MLLNLAGNAVKFTQVGQVNITASLAAGDPDEAMVRLEVTDTGIGIRPEDKEHLFEPFYQVDSSSTRSVGGTGLGLAICKQLVELMGGEIGVQSEVGRGSTFWFTAGRARGYSSPDPWLLAEGGEEGGFFASSPATRVEPLDNIATGAEAGPGLRSTPVEPRIRVLVADDNPVNQRVAALILDRLGYRVDVVANGIEALAALADGGYSVVLMDCQMPQMDGFEVTAEIRKREGSGRHTPIIAMTASARPEDQHRCLSAGMDDYVAKPVTPKALNAAIIRQMRPSGNASVRSKENVSS